MPGAATKPNSTNKGKGKGKTVTTKKRKRTKPIKKEEEEEEEVEVDDDDDNSDASWDDDDDDVWVYEAIVAERIERGGQLKYEVKWANNPFTGESYPNTWEPAKHLPAEAIAAWNHLNRQPTPNAFDLSSVYNSPVKSSRTTKRQSVLTTVKDESRPGQGRATASESRETLNKTQGRDADRAGPSELVGQVPVSRKSARLAKKAQGALPQDDHLSVADSERSGGTQNQHSARESGEDVPVKKRARISQTTIPDSQEFGDSLSTDVVDHSAKGKLSVSQSQSQSQPETQGSGIHTPSRSELSEGGAVTFEVASGARAIDFGPSSPPQSTDASHSPAGPDAVHLPETSDSRRSSSSASPCREIKDSQETEDISAISFKEGNPVHCLDSLAEAAPSDSRLQAAEGRLSPRLQGQVEPEIARAACSRASSLQEPAVVFVRCRNSRASAASEVTRSNNSITSETSPHPAQLVESAIRISPDRLVSQTESSSHSQERRNAYLTNPTAHIVATNSPNVADREPEQLTVSHTRAVTTMDSSKENDGDAPVTADISAMASSLFDDDYEVSGPVTVDMDVLLGFTSRPKPAATSQPSHEQPANAPMTMLDDGGSHGFSNPLGLGLRDISQPPFHPSSLQTETHSDPPVFQPSSLEGQTHPYAHGAVTDHQLPASIAPSQLTMSIAPSSLSLVPAAAQTVPPSSLFGISEQEHGTALPPTTAGQSLLEHPFDSEPDHQKGYEFLVTLPMFATARPLYLETLRSNRSAMMRYNKYSQSESAPPPSQKLTEEVDGIYRKLLAHCDLPIFAETRVTASDEEMMKHATGTNSKFLFVHEFLGALRQTRTKVLILSQPGLVFNYLEAVVKMSGYKHSTYLNSQAAMSEEDDEGQAQPHVVLETTDQDFPWPLHYDVAILFDSTARAVDLARCITPSATVLSLVITCSIEQIDLRLPDQLNDLERRCAMNLVLVESQKAILELPGEETEELAVSFADFVQRPYPDFDYEPQAIPDEFFEVFVSSIESLQSQASKHASGVDTDSSSMTNPRKRPFEGDDDVDEWATPAKRIRTTKSLLPRVPIERTSQLMSDLLKDMMASYRPREQGCAQTVEVPIDQLEWFAAKINSLQESLKEQSGGGTRLREHFKKLEIQHKSQQKTIATNQRKLVESLREATALNARLNDATEKAERLQKEKEQMKAEISALKDKVSTLSAPPKPSAPVDRVKAGSEQAREKVDSASEAAEANAKKDKARDEQFSYMRERYQDECNTNRELRRENQDLHERVSELERVAGETVVRVHEINNGLAQQEYERQLRDLRAMKEHREEDLDKAQKEIRVLKSGRRETRQTSVPRSPRVPMMSTPRPRIGGGAGRAGAGSRGTSPAAGLDGGSSNSATPVPGGHGYQSVADLRLARIRD